MKWQTVPYSKAMKKWTKEKNKNIYFKESDQYFGLKTNLLQELKEKWKWNLKFLWFFYLSVLNIIFLRLS